MLHPPFVPQYLCRSIRVWGRWNEEAGRPSLFLRRPCIRKAPDTWKCLRHVMRALWIVWPKCCHRCLSLKESPLKLNNGFPQSEVLVEVFVLEGDGLGRSFCQSLGAKFLTKFSGLFCWDIQSKMNFSKNFCPKVPWLCAAKLTKIQGTFSWRGSAGGPPPI